MISSAVVNYGCRLSTFNFKRKYYAKREKEEET